MKDVSPDLLSDIQQDLQVTVAELWERLDDRGQVGQANLLSCLWRVNSEHLVDDIQEIGDSLLGLLLRVGLGNQSHFIFILLLVLVSLELGLVVAELLEGAVAEDE